MSEDTATKPKPKTNKTAAGKSDANSGGAKPKKQRGAGSANYPAKPVNEMAEAVTVDRRNRYHQMFTEFMESPGQMFLAAEFGSDQGATRVKRRIEQGDTSVPGNIDDWEISAIRVQMDDGEIGSHLYVTYNG